jgi:hypothetical protein
MNVLALIPSNEYFVFRKDQIVASVKEVRGPDNMLPEH